MKSACNDALSLYNCRWEVGLDCDKSLRSWRKWLRYSCEGRNGCDNVVEADVYDEVEAGRDGDSVGVYKCDVCNERDECVGEFDGERAVCERANGDIERCICDLMGELRFEWWIRWLLTTVSCVNKVFNVLIWSRKDEIECDCDLCGNLIEREEVEEKEERREEVIEPIIKKKVVYTQKCIKG